MLSFFSGYADQLYPGGSQTLPNRKGNKRVNLKPLSVDDSEVVIKKQGLNGVKIQLSNLNEKEIQTSLDFNYDDLTNVVKNSEEEISEKDKRKYTLEELEVEGFSSASSCSKASEFEEVLEDEEEEVDLNSLIEGDVDEIDEEIGKLPSFSARAHSGPKKSLFVSLKIIQKHLKNGQKMSKNRQKCHKMILNGFEILRRKSAK